MKLQLSSKRLQISKANSSIVVILAVSSVVTVFSLVATRTLVQQSRYQQRVISEKQKAASQLKKNLDSVNELVTKYKEFEDAPENVIGGNPSASATGERDGPNSRIILDALPSKYDFPALVTSLDKILTSGGYKIISIGGADEEVNQSQVASGSAESSQPIEMNFNLIAGGSYLSVQKLITDFERSIRPFNVTYIEFSGNDAEMRVSMEAKTYYQPEKNLQIKTKVVK